MATVSVTVGSPDCSWIVHQLPAADFRASGMAKLIVSAPGLALASRIACRSEPAPLSSVLATVKTAGTHRSSSPSSRGRNRGGWAAGRGRLRDRRAARGRSQEETRMGDLHCGSGLRYNGDDITGARRPYARAVFRPVGATLGGWTPPA